jgi:hypothetical protein
MPEKKYSNTQYRLRAGNPINVQGNFVLHTFMKEKVEVEVISCTENLPPASDFRGQGGEYTSASFRQLGSKGGGVFSGKKVKSPEFIDEGAY